MARVALLIGVSEDGLDGNVQNFSRAQLNLEAMQHVLQHPDIGRFGEVKLLLNPDQRRMEQTIEAVFANREKYDLVLLYFSGQVFNDDRDHLYFATGTTQKNQQGELIKSTALAATCVQELIGKGQSEQQVMILDCFLREIATSQLAKNNPVDATQLGKAVVLLSVTPTPYSYKHKGSDLSEYTRYFVEGMETGVADLDNDGVVSVDELHNYTSAKVQTVAPAIKPEIYWGAKGDSNKLVLAKAPLSDPKFKYRKQVERLIKHGEISTVNRRTLDVLREKLGMSLQEAGAIEAGVLQPHRDYQKKLQQYAQALAPETLPEHPEHTHDRLQQLLGLTDADVAPSTAQAVRKPFESLPQVARTRTQNTLTLPREAVPVKQRNEVVVAKATTSVGPLWGKSADPTSALVPENFRLLIGIGIATVLALAGVVSGSLLKPTPPATLPPKPRPATGPETPLQVEQPPERSLVPKPRTAPSPKPRSKLVLPTATSPPLLVPEPRPSARTDPRPQGTPTKPRSRLETPPPVERPRPKALPKPRPASAPKRGPAPTPEPPRTRRQPPPEPPSTPVPLPPATSTPEAPPTSWSEPPPTSGPGPI